MIDYGPPGAEALAWVGAQIGPGVSVVRVERLTGGITSDVDRLVPTGGRPDVVLRRWSDPATWSEHLVERESAALETLNGTTVVAPRLLAADPTGERAGVPSLLMSYVPGRVELAPRDRDRWLDELAGTQAEIHGLPPTLTARAVHLDAVPDLRWIADAGLRAECDAVVDAAAGVSDDVFAHGDFQPFNVLWQGGSVSGVVDWPNAGTGPRGREVGHCCLNLAVLFDADVALEYERRYTQHAGVAPDPAVVTRALLAWDPGWLWFIPRQVAGRAPLDLAGMTDRVITTIRCLLQRMG